MVVVLDAADASLVMGLMLRDVRAVALVTPQNVPMMFRRPIVAVVERPLHASRVVPAIKLAVAELSPRHRDDAPLWGIH